MVKKPTTIQLELTTKCNLNCVTCSRRTLSESRLNHDLTVDNLRHIIKQIPTLKYISFIGLGEPLMIKNVEELFHYAYTEGLIISTIDNGMLLNDDNIRMFLKYCRHLEISFDSPNKQMFNSIRRGADFELVTENIRKLVKAKKDMNSETTITLNFVPTITNYKQIPEMIKLSKELGVDVLKVSSLENWLTPKEDGFSQMSKFIERTREVEDEIMFMVHGKSSESFTKKAKNYLKKNPLIRKLLDLNPMLSKKIRYIGNNGLVLYHDRPKKKSKDCMWSFDKCFITCDGYVTPCCIRMNPDIINFGNIFTRSFDEIWNSDRINEFRKTMKSTKSNWCCANCPD